MHNYTPSIRPIRLTQIILRLVSHRLKLLALLIFIFPYFSLGNPADFKCYHDGKTLILTDYLGPGGEIKIPEAIEGRAITRIHGNAFTGCHKMVSLHIPASVIELGSEDVSSMEGMPKGEHFSINFFQQCSKVTTITVDQANPKYSSLDGVLYDKSQTTLIHYPDARPGSYHISAGVSNIDRTAFDGSLALTEITVDPANAVCSSRDGMLFNKDQTVLLKCPCGKNGTIKIPDGVTRIAENAFYGCEFLTAVEIPASITSMGQSAFLECSNLAQVNIPDQVKGIEKSTFSSCSNLKEIILPIGVNKIGEFAFQSCTNLERVSIPATVTSIGSFAFHGCKKLPRVIIPVSVSIIGDVAFGECDTLAEIQVDAANPRFKSVNGVLFNQELTTMILCPAALSGICTIPSTVTKLDRDVFATCALLTGFKVIEGNPQYSDVDGVLFNHDQTALLQYPQLRSGTYQIPNGVTRISTNAFQKCALLKDVKIPNSVTHLEYGSFSSCTGLTKIDIPASVIVIDEFAFYACKSLSIVTLPPGITKINNCTFSQCSSLTQVTLPKSITEIGSNAFRECTSLASITLPEQVTTIASCAFENCTSLTLINIPAHVTELEMRAFYNCSSLTSAIFLGNAPTLDINVFKKTSPNFKVYYLNGSAGFSSPVWQNLPAEKLAKIPEVGPHAADDEIHKEMPLGK
jgi:BspA type Leucine rich repeat region (6 copies)